MNNLQTEFQKAFALHQRGELDSAEKIYRSILASQPRLFEAAHALGILFLQRGQYKKAEQQLAQAIKLNPRDTSAHNNLGYALLELGKAGEAIAAYTQSIALEPANAGAYSNRADAFARSRRFTEALADLDKAVFYSPNNPQIQNHRGNILGELHRLNEAVAAFGKAIALDPRFSLAFVNRATALAKLRRFDAAAADIEEAIKLQPTAMAYNTQGAILAELKRYNLAIDAFRNALSLDPKIECARSDYVFNKLLICDWESIETDFLRLADNIKHKTAIEKPFVLFSVSSSPEEQIRCAEQFIQLKAPSRNLRPQTKRPSHDRIRVGYVSSDLRDHAVGYLAVGLFEEHDKSRFEITPISIADGTQNKITERITMACGKFIDAARMSDDQVIEMIGKEEIDILVDLNGLTGDARTNIFAARPAPVQVNYLGCAGTLGAPYLDYIIADKHLITDHDERFYAEKVVYLPDTYQPSDSKRKISDKPVSRQDENLPKKGFIFCCFNNSYKILPQIFDIWMRLLRDVEGSVLWINGPNDLARENLKREAERRNISPDRIVFPGFVPRVEDHLARQRLADLFLDTLPYNAHSTASDALWAGLPLLTCKGTTYASRVSASLLNAIGLPELITGSLDEYESLALKLARDPALLGSFRAKLAQNRNTYPLFDTRRYTRHLEAAYATMWSRYEKGQSPRSFSVEPISRGD